MFSVLNAVSWDAVRYEARYRRQTLLLIMNSTNSVSWEEYARLQEEGVVVEMAVVDPAFRVRET